jgi:TatD DNase family protein
MNPGFFDAHNHLQDDRFAGRQSELLEVCAREGVTRMVVNGASEADWPAVLDLSRRSTAVLPSFGYHPWYLHERQPGWESVLCSFLDRCPSAVGEIGLDRWKSGLAYDDQEEVFLQQLDIAAQRDRPVSIHCLRAWGRLHELLRDHARPTRGFLLHSYGGPVEMVPAFAGLGAYFGFPGYYLRAGKDRQRETFRQIPIDRLLVETDAPDQPLPSPSGAAPGFADLLTGSPPHSWSDPRTGAEINHPANLPLVYRGLARIRGQSTPELAQAVRHNFETLFAGL